MGEEERRRVGQRGQVTIPKELRDELGIEGGGEVLVRARAGDIVLETSVTEEYLAEGYRRRASELEGLAGEMAAVSEEADDLLGDTPDWE